MAGKSIYLCDFANCTETKIRGRVVLETVDYEFGTMSTEKVFAEYCDEHFAPYIDQIDDVKRNAKIQEQNLKCIIPGFTKDFGNAADSDS